MTFGSLFAGIGGMDLGLERAGMVCRWQVEIDPFARRVLAKHWPDVRRHDDVKTFPPTDPEDWKVDLICGGFPCQDISFAGRGAGLAGARSGLWFEYARIVGDLRPRYVLVENVSALLVRGLDAVLGTLASLGYDAEWECIPASALGAPHIRERVFILAHSANLRCERLPTVAGSSLQGEEDRRLFQSPGSRESTSSLADPNSPRPSLAQQERQLRGPVAKCGWWATEPDVGRVAHGVPHRVDRLRGLGNAVVPQVAQWIGERIMESASVSK
jgi:DNA (cytosine-5)-methyltransferase 1